MSKNFNRKSEEYQMFNFVLSFGATMAITVYLCFMAGSWLDRRFDTEPWMMLGLVILAIASSLRVLIRDLEQEQKKKDN